MHPTVRDENSRKEMVALEWGEHGPSDPRRPREAPVAESRALLAGWEERAALLRWAAADSEFVAADSKFVAADSEFVAADSKFVAADSEFAAADSEFVAAD